MDVLEVKNLTKKFKTKTGEFTAVNDISLTLKEGEILGLLGPNGAGKTTTIQMLLGVLTPTIGEVIYFGKKLNKHKQEILEQVNFSSTYTHLPWDLTVDECLIFLSYMYKIKNKKDRIKKISDIFSLQKLLSMQIHELSAGQLTRVNLAKAFLNFPRVLLLDEPTASLDPDVAQYIRDFLLNQRKEFQVSIIITSHNMAEVEEVCDRVIFINHGKIIADDTPENLTKTIEICHVKLLIQDGMKRITAYSENQKYPLKQEGRYIIVDLKEQEIPNFLKNIMEHGIYYTEISIEKPSLEDYFLSMSKDKVKS